MLNDDNKPGIVITPKRGFLGGFTIEGHARYAERGKDIVCASVSVVGRMALLGLDKYTQVTAKMSEGFLDVTVYEKSLEVEAILTSAKITLESIATEYPRFVTIKEEDE